MEPKAFFDSPSEREWTDDEMEEFYIPKSGIFIMHIDHPEQGWPIAMYCPICKTTTFILSLYAEKPKNGGYMKINDLCCSETLGQIHDIEIAFNKMQPRFSNARPRDVQQ